nr:ABC transporter permease [uncultured Gellertiella sp.]
MSAEIKQTLVMTRANIGSLPRRAWISLSMILSVALVVCVLIGFLAMAKGFEKALSGAGSDSVAIVLGGGTNQELGSDIPAEAFRGLLAASDQTGVESDGNGKLLISRELLVPVDAKTAREGIDQTLSLRGMDQAGPLLRNNVIVTEGRLFAPGAQEIVVGSRIARDFAGFNLGQKVRLGTTDWTVVGHFSAGSSAFESEIWANLENVQSAFDHQGTVQTLRARLAAPQNIKALQTTLSASSATPLLAVSEAEFYSAQSERTSRLIRLFGWPIALLMAVGATAGALNTMMSSVSDRAVEIATVRTIGFSRMAAFSATWIEAVLLALVGAVVGMSISWAVFNGWQASTLGANNTQLAFNLTVTPDLLLQAGLLALLIGIVGGGLPAFIAARLPLTSALRSRG